MPLERTEAGKKGSPPSGQGSGIPEGRRSYSENHRHRRRRLLPRRLSARAEHAGTARRLRQRSLWGGPTPHPSGEPAGRAAAGEAGTLKEFLRSERKDSTLVVWEVVANPARPAVPGFEHSHRPTT